MKNHLPVAGAVLCSFIVSVATAANVASPAEALEGRNLRESVAELRQQIQNHPQDDQIRFALGIAEFLRSGEKLFQSLYDHGIRTNQDAARMAGLRVPFPSNSDPEPITYQDFRSITEQWMADVQTAEQTLAQIGEDQLQLPVHIGLIRMDLNNDGEAGPNEAWWKLFAAVQRRFEPTAEGARNFVIAFDRGDVAWLRGYCHICLAVGEFILAHDEQKLFEHTAHIFFASPETPLKFPDYGRGRWGVDEWYIADLIAFVHLMRFPVSEPQRLESMRRHLLKATEQSQQMWSYFDDETDDHREWIPNPEQTSAVPTAEVTPQMRKTWIDFLDEAQLVLRGEHLIRYWRAVDDRGINLKKVLTEPCPFVLILWIQGSAAQRYLENGDLTTPGLWGRIQRVFNRQFFRHAFWFN